MEPSAERDDGGFWNRRRLAIGGAMASAVIAVSGCDVLKEAAEDVGSAVEQLDCEAGVSFPVSGDRLPRSYELLDGSPYDDEHDKVYRTLKVSPDDPSKEGLEYKTELAPKALIKFAKKGHIADYEITNQTEATVQANSDGSVTIGCGPKAAG